MQRFSGLSRGCPSSASSYLFSHRLLCRCPLPYPVICLHPASYSVLRLWPSPRSSKVCICVHVEGPVSLESALLPSPAATFGSLRDNLRQVCGCGRGHRQWQDCRLCPSHPAGCSGLFARLCAASLHPPSYAMWSDWMRPRVHARPPATASTRTCTTAAAACATIYVLQRLAKDPWGVYAIVVCTGCPCCASTSSPSHAALCKPSCNHFWAGVSAPVS